MEPFLSRDDEGRPTIDAASISLVREEVRALGAELGFEPVRVAELAIVVSELATNQLRHARLGRIAVRAIERDGVAGIELVATDRGPGIADPKTALAGVPRVSGSLGTGLSSMLRFCDEVDFDVRLGEQTAIFARRFAADVRRRKQVAILGRPFPYEVRSGDDACFVRDGERLRLVLADGLGHGPPARDASAALVHHVMDHGGEPVVVLESAQLALGGTRGAVASICDVDEARGEVTVAAIGNVTTLVVGGERVSGFDGYIGGATPRRKTFVHTQPLGGRGIVIAFTDGLSSSKLRLDAFDDVTREHPLVIAQYLLESFGRTTDDATVVVVA